MEVAIQECADDLAAIAPLVGALTVLDIVFEFAVVEAAVGPDQLAIMHLALLPLSMKLVARLRPSHGPLPMHLVFLELAYVVATIRKVILSITLLHPILVLAFIAVLSPTLIKPSLKPLPMRLIILPRPLILGVPALLVPIIIHELNQVAIGSLAVCLPLPALPLILPQLLVPFFHNKGVLDGCRNLQPGILAWVIGLGTGVAIDLAAVRLVVAPLSVVLVVHAHFLVVGLPPDLVSETGPNDVGG